MTIHLHWRRAAAAVAALGLATLLAGCMLTSEQPLVDFGEGVEVMPENFAMTTYKLTDGAYLPTSEEPVSFAMQDDKTYVSADGTINATFVPIEDDEHMLVIDGADGSMYGYVRANAGIIDIRMVFDGDPAEELAAAGVAVPAGATFADGGVMLTDRASLDAMVELIRNGTIKTSPLIAWVGTGAPPASIIADGDWYRVE